MPAATYDVIKENRNCDRMARALCRHGNEKEGAAMIRWTSLPLECSPKPFRVELFQKAILLNPCWIVLDKNGIAVAMVTRASDATRIAKLLNRQPRASYGPPREAGRRSRSQ
jgi:hypothetical protein